jgi:hypothetical protein
MLVAHQICFLASSRLNPSVARAFIAVLEKFIPILTKTQDKPQRSGSQ